MGRSTGTLMTRGAEEQSCRDAWSRRYLQFPVAQLLCISCSHAVASQGENKVLFLLSSAHREIQEKQRYPLHGNSKLESHEVHFEKHYKPKGMRNEHLAQRWNCGWTNQVQAEPQWKHSYKRWKQSPYFYVIFYYGIIKEIHFSSGVLTTQIFYWEERKL